MHTETLPSSDAGSDFWAPRRHLSLSQARTRSGVVKGLRVLFMAGAAISAGILLGSLVTNAMFAPRGPGDELTNAEAITMRNPRFTGRDETGVPYVITASAAQRNRGNPDLVDLDNPAVEDGFHGTVRAPYGSFHQENQELELFEDVVLTDASGYQFVSKHAKMYVRENRVEGVSPLEGVGPVGRIRADSYEIHDGGARVVLKGRVWTQIQPSSDRRSGE